MGPVATIAYQTLYGEDSRQARQSGNDNTKHTNSQNERSNALANSCVAYAVDGTKNANHLQTTKG